MATNVGPAQVTIANSSLPSGFCPTTEQDRLNEYAKRLSGSLPGSYSTILFQNAVPAATDRDKPWLRINADGTFERIYTYANGAWRSLHFLPPMITTIWVGTQAAIATLDGGTAAASDTETTGQFWREVVNLAGKFPLGAGTLPSGAVISQGTEGGEETHVLTSDELADHLHLVSGSVKAIQYGSGSTADTFYSNAPGSSNFPTGNPTNAATNGKGHNNMPPYHGVYFIRRTSRLYYVQ